MNTSDFLYELPESLIAQTPIEPRDHSRMLVYDRATGQVQHKHFYDLPKYLRPGDALVLNDTKVIPARLIGQRENGGACELLLLRQQGPKLWETLAKPGKRLKQGAKVSFGDGQLSATIEQITKDGGRIVSFECEGTLEAALDQLGQMPLPPYIHEKLSDPSRYQTVYAREPGSAAAPTAGLHFTPALMEQIEQMGVQIIPVLLHVGLGTFRPVKAEQLEDHVMHSEYYSVPESSAEQINQVHARGGRIIAIGTTSVRTLESAANDQGQVQPKSGDTSIFIKPGYHFKAVDALITNFHLPGSTLLMLISAMIGREQALSVYEQAVREEYRFFSFGDAMLIL
ncbi:tRNA preQ1(34) S-adenosylmethionine ribosyltransferase-isomerase QueA [Eubacteriales bacterium OttesenSCG-928-N13]|nr:tRNA preQ1(34) S-adenosylmethionine ribosyltransferase-isomerase QueA [Eubacteriales bacterium OttesenSCG-928-N13]